jgi:precorrin-2 dehydrogenase/sirohydrochlorin ferrochelatase
MPAYPLLLDLTDRLCVVVGAGTVGRRKLDGLLAAGARVRVVDPEPPPLPSMIELRRRPYRHGDLDGALLAIAACSDRATNATIAADAHAAGILVNVVDDPAAGNFVLPAVLRRGALTVSVASDGASPALAALLRDRLEAELGPEWATVAEIAAALRRKRLTPSPHPDYNREVLRHLLAAGLAEKVVSGDPSAVDALLGAVCGADINLATLGIRIAKGIP